MADTAPAKSKKVRTKANIPENESKRDRFMRVAEPRVKNAIKAMNLIAACGNKATYDYAPEDVDRIQNVLVDAYKRIEAAFSGKATGEPEFSFRR